MTEIIAKFIENNIDLIEANEFEELYNVANDELMLVKHICELTESLLSAGINPLLYLEIIPEAYLARSILFESLNIPDNIVCINQRAFQSNIQLKVITLPKTLQIIEREAFLSCVNLRVINMNCIYPVIEDGAFKFCTIREIYYAGTKEEWNALINDCQCDQLRKCPYIKCVDGEVEKS